MMLSHAASIIFYAYIDENDCKDMMRDCILMFYIGIFVNGLLESAEI